MFMKVKKMLSRTKGKVALFLVAALALQILLTSLAGTPTFKDVPATYWAYTEIEEAYADGAVNGTSSSVRGKYFSPENTLTLAHFTAIMCRAFYADEVSASTANGTWYAKEEAVAKKHNLLNGLTLTASNPATRYEMAVFITNLLNDLGLSSLATSQISEVSSKIGDWNNIPATYRTAVATVYYYGIIQGTSEGNFAGSNSVKRSHVGAIYSRLKKTVKNELGLTIGKIDPDTPVSNAIGTMSGKPVTLSLDTHCGKVYDYWSKQTAEIRNAVNKDAFNAAVQTFRDYEMVQKEGSRNTWGNNYYNYAVFPTVSMDNLQTALTNLKIGNGTFRAVTPTSCAYMYIDATYNDLDEAVAAAMEPILSQLNDSMTDYEKAVILVKGITDKFEYGLGSAFTWTTGTTGSCSHFALVTNSLFSAAGIPIFEVQGKILGTSHSWNEAYLDGEWYVIESTLSEKIRSSTNPNISKDYISGIISIEDYEARYDTNKISSETLWIKITKALVEAAGW